MADWTRQLNLVELLEKARAREITAQAAAAEIARLLEQLSPHGKPHERVDEFKADLVDQFNDFAESEGEDFDDMDWLLRQLYDWGNIALDSHFDGKKACWIKTF